MIRLQLKNGHVYLLNDHGAVLDRSDGPVGFEYSGEWVILGFSRRYHSHQIISLAEALAGENVGQGWIHDLDHGTHRMWGHPTGRRLARIDRLLESRPI